MKAQGITEPAGEEVKVKFSISNPGESAPMLRDAPSIIHLTSKDGSIPEAYTENYDALRRQFSDHRIIVHSDYDIHTFVAAEYPHLHRYVFRLLPHDIMRFDMVRYLWMHTYGGMYMDLDILVHKREEFSGDVLFFEREWTHPQRDDITTSIHNCIFASMPGEQIWLDICQTVWKNLYLHFLRALLRLRRIRKKEVFDITGPNAISDVISSKAEAGGLDGVTILDAQLIYQPGMSSHNGADALVVHQASGSWK